MEESGAVDGARYLHAGWVLVWELRGKWGLRSSEVLGVRDPGNYVLRVDEIWVLVWFGRVFLDVENYILKTSKLI